jgi:Fic family protein
MYVRKEAVLSSQIEGTNASLADLLLHEEGEAPGAPIADLEETSAYIASMNHGLAQIRDPAGLPLSTRLLRDMHRLLLATGRGSTKQPGEIRSSQNWIGGDRPGNATFVAPPHQHLRDLLGNLENYLHSGGNPVVKAAVAHAQFETIHPFLDGNGRIGRQLITLVLCDEGLLAEPVLYLSLYLKQHRSTYYDLLNDLRENGSWERWIDFFCQAVISTARSAIDTARDVGNLIARNRGAVALAGTPTTVRVFDHLVRRPVLVNAPAVGRSLSVARPTMYSALGILEDLGIAAEVTGRSRNRVWVYRDYMDILNAGTDTPPG